MSLEGHYPTLCSGYKSSFDLPAEGPGAQKPMPDCSRKAHEALSGHQSAHGDEARVFFMSPDCHVTQVATGTRPRHSEGAINEMSPKSRPRKTVTTLRQVTKRTSEPSVERDVASYRWRTVLSARRQFVC